MEEQVQGCAGLEDLGVELDLLRARMVAATDPQLGRYKLLILTPKERT